MRAFTTRAVAAATAAAIALTTTGFQAFAASNPDKPAQVKEATVTDLSAAKKRYRARRGIDPAGRAFLGIAGTMFGVVAANIAAERYRDRYYRPYGYYGYQGYGYPYGGYHYAPGPYYYGGYPY